MKPVLIVCGIAVAIALNGVGSWLASAASKGGGGKPVPVSDTPVKVTFRNQATPPDRLLSVGSDTYTNGDPGVTAVIQGSSGWLVLTTCFNARKGARICSSQGRYHFFDYTDPANPLLPMPAETMTEPGHFNVWGFAVDGVTKLAGGLRDVMNFPGETRLAGMKVNYFHHEAMYTLRFTPNMYPNSSYLLLTYLGGGLPGAPGCTLADSGTCASWSVESFTGVFAANPANCCFTETLTDVAEFVTGDNSEDYGQFHMPFKMTVTVLPK